MGRYHLNKLEEHKQLVKKGPHLQSTDMASEPVLQQYYKIILLLSKVTLEEGSGNILPLLFLAEALHSICCLNMSVNSISQFLGES